MLAEKKRRVKWSLNPRGNLWSQDSNKFGQRMLEKMGWKPGSGLGANAQGITEHIKVAYKSDNKCIGYKEHGEEWIEQQSEFENFLLELSNSHTNDKTSVKEEKESESLEQISRQSRARVHYQKFTRGKDLSRCTNKDLACILGVKKTNITKDEEELNVDPAVGEIDKSYGVITVNGGNMNEYFNKIKDKSKPNSDDEVTVTNKKKNKTKNTIKTEESFEINERNGVKKTFQDNTSVASSSNFTDPTVVKKKKKSKIKEEEHVLENEITQYNKSIDHMSFGLSESFGSVQNNIIESALINISCEEEQGKNENKLSVRKKKKSKGEILKETVSCTSDTHCEEDVTKKKRRKKSVAIVGNRTEVMKTYDHISDELAESLNCEQNTSNELQVKEVHNDSEKGTDENNPRENKKMKKKPQYELAEKSTSDTSNVLHTEEPKEVVIKKKKEEIISNADITTKDILKEEEEEEEEDNTLKKKKKVRFSETFLESERTQISQSEVRSEFTDADNMDIGKKKKSKKTMMKPEMYNEENVVLVKEFRADEGDIQEVVITKKKEEINSNADFTTKDILKEEEDNTLKKKKKVRFSETFLESERAQMSQSEVRSEFTDAGNMDIGKKKKSKKTMMKPEMYNEENVVLVKEFRTDEGDIQKRKKKRKRKLEEIDEKDPELDSDDVIEKKRNKMSEGAKVVPVSKNTTEDTNHSKNVNTHIITVASEIIPKERKQKKSKGKRDIEGVEALNKELGNKIIEQEENVEGSLRVKRKGRRNKQKLNVLNSDETPDTGHLSGQDHHISSDSGIEDRKEESANNKDDSKSESLNNIYSRKNMRFSEFRKLVDPSHILFKGSNLHSIKGYGGNRRYRVGIFPSKN